MAVQQSHYRFGSDSGTESTYPFLAAEDTAIAFEAGVTFLLRICLQCDATLASNVDAEFQVNRNSLGWNNVTTSSAVARAVTTAVFANGADLTKRLSGTGTFKSLQDGGTHDGIAGGNNMDIASNGNTETVCSIQLVAGDVVAGDTIQFRLTRDGGVLLDTYSVTPTITVLAPALLAGVVALVVTGTGVLTSAEGASFDGTATMTVTTFSALAALPSAPLQDETGAELLDEYGHEALYDETAVVALAAELAGAAAVTLTTASALTTSIRLAGAASLTVSSSAVLTTSIPLAGAATASLTTAGALTTAIRLAGAASVTLTTAADLATGAGMTGAATASLTTAGALTTGIRLTGAATATLTTAGALTTAIRLTSAPMLVLTAAASLTTAIPLTAAATVRLTATADLLAISTLGGAATLRITTTGALTTAIRLAGAATVRLTASAALPPSFLGALELDFGRADSGKAFSRPGAPTFTGRRPAKTFTAQGTLEVVRGPSTDDFTAGEREGG